jgi:hypothetical protein
MVLYKYPNRHKPELCHRESRAGSDLSWAVDAGFDGMTTVRHVIIVAQLVFKGLEEYCLPHQHATCTGKDRHH